MAGDRAEHTNRFFDILRGLPHVEYFLLNTGGIGDGPNHKAITVEHTMAILDSLLRGGLEDWVKSPTGFKVPKAPGVVDDIYMHPENLYSMDEFKAKQRKLNHVRHDAIEKIGDKLHPSIRRVFSPHPSGTI